MMIGQQNLQQQQQQPGQPNQTQGVLQGGQMMGNRMQQMGNPVMGKPNVQQQQQQQGMVSFNECFFIH